MSHQICFVLTSDGRDVHADMTLISAQFIRRSNRNVSIVVLSDDESEACLTQRRHPLLGYVDRLVPVSAPSGPAGFRNRFVKTQMRRHLEGPMLYLDADTLVLKPLDEIFSCDAAIGAVSNHNGPANPCEIGKVEKKVFLQIGWPVPRHWYVNGGVLYLNDSNDTHRFFDAWHAKWQIANNVTGKHFDQPSLNSALNETSPSFCLLDHRFNAQVCISPWSARGAAIWHIYHSALHPSPKNVLETCLRVVRDNGSLPELLIDEISRGEHPWCVENRLDAIAVKTILKRKAYLDRHSMCRLWLARKYHSLLPGISMRILRKVSRILR